MRYRPEIDGLRTIAVLSVVIYHAQFSLGGGRAPFLPGGYVGVDVFFVISGFLITSLILKELAHTGRFSLAHFYERRARRLLPALLTVIAAATPFAWFYLLPAQLIDFAWSLISSLLFGSNFYWYQSMQVYGAESSLLKPLLHTWSLAVEEQYYVLFPLLVMLLYQRARPMLVPFMALLAVASLLAAQRASTFDASFSFYMLPTRIWELLSGALLAWYFSRRSQGEHAFPWLPTFGLGLILASCFLMDENSHHPGIVTAIPVLGTILIIAFASPRDPVTRLLSTRLFVSVGLISYSLYLWHYPVFAFLRIEDAFDSAAHKAAAIGASLALSVVSYRLVERPFRSRRRVALKTFLIALGAGSLLMAGLAVLTVIQKGFPGRFDGVLALAEEELIAYRKKYWGRETRYVQVGDFTGEKPAVVVIGNSWGRDIANALSETGRYEVAFSGSTGFQCKALTLPDVSPAHRHYDRITQECARNREWLMQDFASADLVILADHRRLTWIHDTAVAKAARENVGLLRSTGFSGPILVISNRPVYEKPVPWIIKDYGFTSEGVNRYAERFLNQEVETLRATDRRAADFYERLGVHYFSLVDNLCADSWCRIVENNLPLYHDGAHLTLTGALRLSEPLSDYVEQVFGKSDEAQ